MNKEFDVYKNYTSTSMLTGLDERELTQWSIRYFSANIAPHLPKNRDARIIEIGCGYGRNLQALQELGYGNVRGIDISEEQIDYARNRLGLTNAEVGDAVAALEGAEETYDAILLLDVLEHLELTYSVRLIQTIRGALKPGGIFVIQVPNAMSPLSPNRHWDITHFRAYTTHSMEQHLRLGGFTEMRHYELPPHVHGMASLIRRALWFAAVKPLISAYMLVANSNRMGGIYTANMLTVACRKSAP
jgi:2-polyprenyl-3-methyl-5-hydroxy-6-metoxy-1,4-benzoquinol methylase